MTLGAIEALRWAIHCKPKAPLDKPAVAPGTRRLLRESK